MNFIFHQGKPAAPVLVLLHGTGGDERFCFDLGHDLDPQASLLGIRGNVFREWHAPAISNDYQKASMMKKI